jgi:hypothetical protein
VENCQLTASVRSARTSSSLGALEKRHCQMKGCPIFLCVERVKLIPLCQRNSTFADYCDGSLLPCTLGWVWSHRRCSATPGRVCGHCVPLFAFPPEVRRTIATTFQLATSRLFRIR